MNKYLIGLVLFFNISAFAQQNLQTVFETSDGKETSTYQQTIEFYKVLASSSAYVQLKEMGNTDADLPLHLVIIDAAKDFDFEASHRKNKTVILINNGIHPGEPDGIEASKMLARDLVTSRYGMDVLNNLVIAIIPTYNIGGALNRNSTTRVNQNGPEAYGFRGNARNFDLNRDFIKADTRNALSFHGIFHTVKPHLFIDTHVSNGADYQYTITHITTQHNKLGGDLGQFVENQLTPTLEERMKAKGSEITPFVNVYNKPPDAEGFSQFMDWGRYSTGYAALFNVPGFMIETHMLKPFSDRVKSSYNFLETVIQLGKEHGDELKTLISNRKKYFVPGNLHAIQWELDNSKSKEISFKGYSGVQQKSEVTGADRLFYDREKPFTKQIPFFNTYKAVKEIVIPKAYVIPKGWHTIIDRLKRNRCSYSVISNDTTINVETYVINNFETVEMPYEGHYLHYNTTIETEKQTVHFSEGDYIFYINEQTGRFLVETLEPEAPDSYFTWNFFDTILQQKEHFSPYVFEEVAKELLETNDALRMAFENKKQENEDFRNNWYAQLDFIYKHSKHHEAAYMKYPVYRLVD